MKKICLCLMFCFLTNPVFSMTPEELEQAETTLSEMATKINLLHSYVYFARTGIVQGIALSPAQKDELKQLYNEGKADITDLYKLLP